MNVVVGQSLDHKTPIFVEELEYVVFRPYWVPPYGITVKEIVPHVRRDPSYFTREDLQIVAGGEDDSPELTPTPENLAAVVAGTLHIRQKPGPKNSLGLAKFIFPNSENVYMHGTPAQQLFSRVRRDFSHGCIRLEDPARFAQWVLRDEPEWTRERIDAAMQGTKPTRVESQGADYGRALLRHRARELGGRGVLRRRHLRARSGARRGAQARISLSREELVSSEGRRPSDSPTRALARRGAGSLRPRGSLATLTRAVYRLPVYEIASGLLQGASPSDSPTRALARCCAGSLRSRGSLAILTRAVTCWQFMRQLVASQLGRAALDVESGDAADLHRHRRQRSDPRGDRPLVVRRGCRCCERHPDSDHTRASRGTRTMTQPVILIPLVVVIASAAGGSAASAHDRVTHKVACESLKEMTIPAAALGLPTSGATIMAADLVPDVAADGGRGARGPRDS